MKFKWVIFFFTCLVFVHALSSFVRISTTFAPDFSVFYEAARGLVRDQNIYTLPMYTGFGYPPFTLLPFIPLLVFPYQLAQIFWVIVSFTLLLYSISLSFQVLGKKASFIEFCLVFSLCFMAFPTKFTLGMGQVNILALVLFLSCIVADQKKHVVRSGILLGLALIIKPHFLLFIPLFVFAKKWKQIVISFCVVTLGILITGLLYGWDLYEFYTHVTVPPLLVFAGREIYYNQGLGSFFSRMLPLGIAAAWTKWVSVLLIGSSWWMVWRRKMTLTRSVLLFIPVFLFVEPLSWQHHYVFLLPVYVYLVERFKKDTVRLGILGISFLLVAANIQQPELIVNLPWSGFVLSHVFIGNAILFGLLL